MARPAAVADAGERAGAGTRAGRYRAAEPAQWPESAGAKDLVGGVIDEQTVQDLMQRLARAESGSGRPAVAGILEPVARSKAALAGTGIAVGVVLCLLLMWVLGSIL